MLNFLINKFVLEGMKQPRI